MMRSTGYRIWVHLTMRPGLVVPLLRSALSTWIILFGALALTALADCPTPADCKCTQDNSFYENQHYVVKGIQIETPLSIIGTVQKQFDALKPLLLLKEGEAFTVAKYILSQDKLKNEFGTLTPGERAKVVYIVPSLRACDTSTSPPGLIVVYRIYTSESFSYLAGIFENRNDKISRSLVPGRISSETNQVLPQPYIGYNATRGLFGGTRGSFQTTGGVFNKMDVDVSGSSSSSSAELGLSGSRNFKGSVSHADWRLGYRYSNTPASPIRLKEGTMLAQFFAGTQPIGPQGVILRFGASVEGGNRQTNLDEASVPTSDLAQTRHAALKMYLGGTMNRGRQSWTASYGFQLGSTGTEPGVDYSKHIIDTAYSARWLPRDHSPLRLDIQAGAGFIQSSSGRVPIAERFFGGNVQTDFIQGADWLIRSSPMIRSFPQNRLNRIGEGTPIGGERYFSVNTTIAQTIWKYAAVPADVIGDPNVRIALGGQIAGAGQATAASYLVETDGFKGVLKQLAGVAAELKGIQDDFEDIKSKNPNQNVLDSIDNAQSDISDTKDAIGETTKTPNVGTVRQVLVGFVGISPSMVETVTADIDDLLELIKSEPALSTQRSKLAHDKEQLESTRSDAAKSYQQVRSLALVDPQLLKPIIDRLDDLTASLNSIQQVLPELPAGSPQETVDLVNSVKAFVKAAMNAVGRAQSDQESAKTNLDLLATGFGPAAPAYITSVVDDIRRLEKPFTEAGLTAQWQSLDVEAGKLRAIQVTMNDLLRRVPESDVQKKAKRDIAYTGRVLDVVFRELNLFAVSPLFMLDAARIGPKTTQGFGGFRYGVGPGLRFSVVTMDINLGYSFNPNRRPGEGRGAFVFSLEIADLFR